MSRAGRFVIRNWFWLTAGLVLTRIAAEYAYTERGYAAIGGEWLVLPVLLAAKYMIGEVVCIMTAASKGGTAGE